jgi:hypothetical protein
MVQSGEADGAPIQKPLNFFVIVAALAMLVVVWQDASALTSHIDRGNMISPLEPSLFRNSLLFGQTIRSLLLSATNYTGLALIVELVDRVRWRLLSRSEQVAQQPRYLISRLRRRL